MRGKSLAPYQKRDGHYEKTLGIRLPDEVIRVYEDKAKAVDLSVTTFLKKVLIDQSGVGVSPGPGGSAGPGP